MLAHDFDIPRLHFARLKLWPRVTLRAARDDYVIGMIYVILARYVARH
jgi:hypothetical protein